MLEDMDQMREMISNLYKIKWREKKIKFLDRENDKRSVMVK